MYSMATSLDLPKPGFCRHNVHSHRPLPFTPAEKKSFFINLPRAALLKQIPPKLIRQRIVKVRADPNLIFELTKFSIFFGTQLLHWAGAFSMLTNRGVFMGKSAGSSKISAVPSKCAFKVIMPFISICCNPKLPYAPSGYASIIGRYEQRPPSRVGPLEICGGGLSSFSAATISLIFCGVSFS